jgi:endonuclease/exonuclease/phosphatase family metal-dependent hydrolase
VRLATFNVLHGRSVEDQTVDPERLRTAVRRIDADVLCLQEVDFRQPRSHHADMTGTVAEAMGAPAWRFEPTLLGLPGGAWRRPDTGEGGHGSAGATDKSEDPAQLEDLAPSEDSAEAAYGVGLVSRYPVRYWRGMRFAAAPMRSPVLMPGTSRPMLLIDEPRAGIAAVLATPDGPLTVVCTHLSFVPGWNARQLRQLTAAVTDLPDPLVMLGDLNLPGVVPRLVTGWRQLARVPTYPAWHPRVQLDHALARTDGWAPTSVHAVPLPISDHCALVIDTPLPARRPLAPLPQP